MTNVEAAVVERNKLVNRRIARVVGCAGFTVRSFDAPEQLDAAALDGLRLIVGDAFDADPILRCLDEHAALQAILYSAEPDAGGRLAKRALASPRLVALVGRPGFDVAPREADLLLIARRAAGGEPAPFEAHLAWGADGFACRLHDGAERDQAVAETVAFAARLGAPRRVAEMLGELAHELVMNALYDAPVDGDGRPRFAHDRKATIRLGPEDAASFHCASDGVRIAVEVSDRFGRLERRHVFGGLGRALSSGQLDTAGGGAGLGMMVAYRSTTALFFDVARGRRTRVTGLFDLDLNLREFRTLGKTIHFPEAA
jgi:hypothetical protein